MVLSIMAYSLSASAARCWKIRFQTLDLALREKRVWILIGSPNRSGRSGRRAAAVPCGRQSPGDAARRVPTESPPAFQCRGDEKEAQNDTFLHGTALLMIRLRRKLSVRGYR